MVEATIPHLEGDTTVDRLDIADARLRFDPDPEAIKCDDGVPSVLVSRDRESDLRSPSPSGMEEVPDPTQKFQLRGVAHRRGAREGAHVELQPDH